MVQELTRDLRGWLGYLGKCEPPAGPEQLERWLRRRLRPAIWNHKRRTRFWYHTLGRAAGNGLRNAEPALPQPVLCPMPPTRVSAESRNPLTLWEQGCPMESRAARTCHS